VVGVVAVGSNVRRRGMTVELYDTHRRDGTCLPPHHLGLKPTKNGIWQHPTC
jgi:hypothetical protein